MYRHHSRRSEVRLYIRRQLRQGTGNLSHRAWLERHLGALTDANEAGRPEPWAMADAPADYLARLMRGIVGVSLAVGSLEGRWKLSQNHPDANRRGVIEGLAASDRAQDRAVADAMARLEAGGGG